MSVCRKTQLWLLIGMTGKIRLVQCCYQSYLLINMKKKLMLYLNLFSQIVAYIANKWLTVTNYTCIPIIERLLKTEATPKKYKLFKNISTITLQIMEHLMNSYSHELTVYVLGTCRLPYNLYLASNSVSSINLIPFQHCLREMSLPLGRVFFF